MVQVRQRLGAARAVTHDYDVLYTTGDFTSFEHVFAPFSLMLMMMIY